MLTSDFHIIEQFDGRYICVRLYDDSCAGLLRKGETLVSFEEDCRSTNRCYEEISEYMIDSGNCFDGPAVIYYHRFPGDSYNVPRLTPTKGDVI